MKADSNSTGKSSRFCLFLTLKVWGPIFHSLPGNYSFKKCQVFQSHLVKADEAVFQ